MKNFLIFILAFVMLLTAGFACAEGMDFVAMSDEQLQAIIEGAQAELSARKGTETNNDVLIDQDGVKMYLTGKHEVWGYEEDWYLDLEVVVENNRDTTISILADGSSVNGWNVACFGVSDTQAGKKQKGNLELYITEAEISTFEEVEEIEFVLMIYDSENWEVVNTLEPIVVNF